MNGQNYSVWRDRRVQELLSKEKYNLDDLCDVVVILRGEGGCPWDREQDHHSIRGGLIEECYEVVEAIDKEDASLLREELGDLLLQILFHTDIEKDAGRFDLDDVANEECVKMIHRHPHVFGQVQVENSDDVLKNWDVIKTEEKQRLSVSDQLRSIPPVLPALIRAQKVAKKTGYGQGLDAEELISRVQATLDALRGCEDAEQSKALLGQALFEMTGVARALHLDSEEALFFETERKISRAEELAKQG